MNSLKLQSKLKVRINKRKQFSHYKKPLILMGFMSFSMAIFGQENLGGLDELVAPYIDSKAKGLDNKDLVIKASPREVFNVDIKSNDCTKENYYLFGKVEGKKNTTFYLRGNRDGVEGKIIDYVNKRAFVLNSNDHKDVVIEEVDIHTQVCIIEEKDIEADDSNREPWQYVENNSIPQLESLPGAPGVVYLDWDGEKVSGGAWGNIDAQPSGASDEFIEEAFYVTAENFAAFNINVTTIRSVYDKANKNSRQMVIYNTTYPNNPGVAMFNSFNNGSGEPCWVKMGGPVAHGTKGGNVGTHEAGHTLGLKHDGSPAGEYYKGHAEYRVIMGTVSNGFSQWSKGEYKDANNKEDDLAIISGNKNNVGYREDDHGNDIGSASELVIENDGTVKEDENFGIIGKTSDLDLFKMELVSGTLDITVRPADKYDFSQSLDVKIRLLDAKGEEIASADGNSFEASTIKEEIGVESSATFYLEIDGVGKGDPQGDGYSEYGSIGQFFISGKVPVDPTGIDDVDLSSQIEVFPVPSKDKVFITHGFNKVNYELVTLHGAMVTQGLISGNKTSSVDISSFEPGIYLLKIIANEGTAIKKIVIE